MPLRATVSETVVYPLHHATMKNWCRRQGSHLPALSRTVASGLRVYCFTTPAKVEVPARFARALFILTKDAPRLFSALGPNGGSGRMCADDLPDMSGLR